MLYPKIPRKSIALLLLCLIFTLVAVGFSFLIYFFYNTTDFMDNLRNRWYLTAEGQYHHYQDTVNEYGDGGGGGRAGVDGGGGGVGGPYTHFLANDIGGSVAGGHHQRSRHFPSLMGHQATGEGPKHHGFKYVNQLGIDNRLINTGETIYIDDYDKINEKSMTGIDGSDLDMTSIEYFDQIISDHSVGSTNGDLQSKINRLDSNIDAGKHDAADGAGGAGGKHVLIFTKEINEIERKNTGLRQSPKIIQAKADIEIEHIDEDDGGDDDDDDDTLISSGSGDFPGNHQFYKNQNNKENLYSVSSEIISNLSPAVGIPSPPSSSSVQTAERNSTEYPFPAQIDHEKNPEAIITTAITASVTDLNSNQILQRLVQSSPGGGKKISTMRQYRQHHHRQHPTTSDTERLRTGHKQRSSTELKVTIDDPQLQTRQHQRRRNNNNNNNNYQSGIWLETKARRIMGNVEKSEERSRQLLLCEEAGGGELCRMLFKGHINE